MIDTMEKLHEALGYPSISNGDSLVDLAVNELKHVQDLRSGLSLSDNRNNDLSQTIEARDHVLEEKDEEIVELREYIDYLLRSLDTKRKMLKVIARVGDGTVARLVDNTLAGYYHD